MGDVLAVFLLYDRCIYLHLDMGIYVEVCKDCNAISSIIYNMIEYKLNDYGYFG